MPEYHATYEDGIPGERRITAPSLDEARELFAALMPSATLTGLAPVTAQPQPPAAPPAASTEPAQRRTVKVRRGQRWCTACAREVTPKASYTGQIVCWCVIVASLVLIPCTAGLSLIPAGLFFVIALLDAIFPTKTCPICNAKSRQLARHAPA